MIQYPLLLLICLAFAHLSQGQTHRGEIDLSLGIGPGAIYPAVSWHRSHPVLFDGKFKLGYGVRSTFFFGSDIAYVTAPANVTEGNLFTPQNEEKMDTLTLPSPNTNSINAAVYLSYQINEKWSAGFNIDVIGFTFGSSQLGSFEAETQNTSATDVRADVTAFNLLLTGDYDLGSLNSELYGRYQLNDQIALRAGFSFVISEYTTAQALAFGNDRFRNKTLGGLLAVSYQF